MKTQYNLNSICGQGPLLLLPHNKLCIASAKCWVFKALIHRYYGHVRLKPAVPSFPECVYVKRKEESTIEDVGYYMYFTI